MQLPQVFGEFGITHRGVGVLDALVNPQLIRSVHAPDIRQLFRRQKPGTEIGLLMHLHLAVFSEQCPLRRGAQATHEFLENRHLIDTHELRGALRFGDLRGAHLERHRRGFPRNGVLDLASTDAEAFGLRLRPLVVLGTLPGRVLRILDEQ